MTNTPPRKQLQTVTKITGVAVSLLALIWVLRHVNMSSLAQVLSQANPWWIAAALVIFGLGFALAAARWHIVLRLSQFNVTPGATLRAVLVGHLFNTLLFGPTGGDIAKSALYARCYGFPTPGILATCVVDRFLGGAGFLIFAICTPGFGFFSQHWSERLSRMAGSRGFALFLGVIALLAFCASLVRHKWNWHSPLRRLSQALVANSSQLISNPRLALAGLGCAVLCHLCVSGVFLFSLKAVTQTPFSLAAVFWVFPVISLITSAPVTFSGAGLREGAALYFLGLYKIPAEDAVGASLLVLFTYLVWALLGSILFLRGRVRREEGPGAGTLAMPEWKATPDR